MPGRIALAHSPSLATLDYELIVVAVTDDGAIVTGAFEDSVVR